MPYIYLHASQHLITANYQRLPCAIWCVFFLQAIPNNYTYIMSSSESLLHKGSPSGSFSIGQRREMAHIHLDQCCPGQANPPHPGQTSPDHSSPLPRLKRDSDHGAANPTTPDSNHFNLHLSNKWWERRKKEQVGELWRKTGLVFSSGCCFVPFSLFFCLYSIHSWWRGEK